MSFMICYLLYMPVAGQLTLILSQAGKKLLESKATFVAVGNTYLLPYAEDLGLSV